MKFNSDSAKMKFNAGMSKKAIEDGYEIVPSEGQFFAGTMANKRLGLISEELECADEMTAGSEEADD